METLGPILAFAGLILFIVGGFWFLVAAFRVSLWWGLACLFIPIVQLFFLIVHWAKARDPFLLQVLAFGLMLLGYFLNPHAFHH